MIAKNEIDSKDFSLALQTIIGKLHIVHDRVYQGNESESEKLALVSILDDSINDLETINDVIHGGQRPSKAADKDF